MAPAMFSIATATIERYNHCPVWLSVCASFNWQFACAMLKPSTTFSVFRLNDLFFFQSLKFTVQVSYFDDASMS